MASKLSKRKSQSTEVPPPKKKPVLPHYIRNSKRIELGGLGFEDHAWIEIFHLKDHIPELADAAKVGVLNAQLLHYQMYGKQGVIKGRRAVLFAPASLRYRYNGNKGSDEAIPECNALAKLRQALNARISIHKSPYFNSCLVNIYDHDGHLGAHSDDERDLRRRDFIVGATVRTGPPVKENSWRLVIRRKTKDTKTNPVVLRLPLRHNEFYAMCGPLFQTLFTHEVPRQKRPQGAQRISLTFRMLNNK